MSNSKLINCITFQLKDGGDGKIGLVVDIRGWDNESGRSVANVVWASGSTNVYRIGHKGKVDLKLVHTAVGGFYYREALPVLGLSNDSASKPLRGPGSPRSRISFSVGDKVKIIVDADRLREMQEGHGGWNPRMAEVCSFHSLCFKCYNFRNLNQFVDVFLVYWSYWNSSSCN